MIQATPKIYLIDDDAFCLAIYKQLLNGMGYHDVRIFLKAQECLDQLASNPPDIIFMDYEMVPSGGMDPLYHIRSLYPQVKIIFLSGQGNMQKIIDSFDPAHTQYIVKGNGDFKKIKRVMEFFFGDTFLHETSLN
jgi:polysaccharide export outer membrane protein